MSMNKNDYINEHGEFEISRDFVEDLIEYINLKPSYLEDIDTFDNLPAEPELFDTHYVLDEEDYYIWVGEWRLFGGSVSGASEAENVSIIDTGEYFASTNVEGALQEVALAKAPLASPNFSGTPSLGGQRLISNNSATGTAVYEIWSGTQAQYDAIGTKDANTLYFIV